MEWFQEEPERLHLRPQDGPALVLRRGDPRLSDAARRASRLEPVLVEGFLEAFAPIYRDAAELIEAQVQRHPPDPLAATAATAWDGLLVMRFIEAAVASHLNRANGTDLEPSAGAESLP